MFGSGFGNRTTSAFGQTSTFGKPTTSFSTPGFGGTNASLFGQTSQASTSLFGSTTPSFGQTTTAQSFGGFGSGTNTSMFGAQQPAAGTSGNIFGAQNTTQNSTGSGLFGSSTPTSFGTNSGFGSFGQSTNAGGLFGQTQPTQTQSASLFGQSNPSGSSLFGSTTNTFAAGNAPVGTTVKFNPVIGADTIIKSGVTQNISIKHHCITCMKEYESKSLEELRYEDYMANRKGPSQGTQAGAGLFGGGGQTSLFGGATSTSNTTPGNIFGNNSAFGQANVFGQNSMQNNSNLFGKPAATAPFGGSTTAQPSGFSSFNQGNSLFGANSNQPKPAFGATQPGTGLFGSNTSATNTFGTQNNSFAFNSQQQPNQGIGLFGQQNKFGAFGNAPQTTSNFTFGQNNSVATNSLFGQKTPTPGFGVTTTTCSFGTAPFGSSTTPTGGGLFSGGFNKTQPSGFSFGQNTAATPLGGSNLSAGSLFGNQAKPGGGIFSNAGTSSTGLFGSGGFGTNVGFGSSASSGFGCGFNLGGNNFNSGTNSLQNPSATPNIHDQIQVLAAIPYGTSPLYKHINPSTGKTDELLRPSFVVQKPNGDSNFKVSTQITNIVNRKAHSYVEPAKKSLFDKIEEEVIEGSLSQKRQSPRFLKLKPKLIINKNKVAAKTDENRGDTTYTISTLSRKADIAPTTSESTEIDDVSMLSSSLNKNDSLFERDTVFETKSQKKSPCTRKSVSFSMNDITSQSEEASYSFANESTESGKENDQTSDNEREHVCGIKLTRNDYFTVPTLCNLDDIVDAEGKCVVENFTIGRHKYGNVTFYDAFDVAGLDLDSIVFFRHKEIEIYPNDEVKPPVGVGLNRRAQVTLDRVWPIDKSTREIIKEPGRLKHLNFEEKLKRASNKMNARFIEYRSITGSWVFEVEHFSKYGLDDSDEDDTNKIIGKTTKSVQTKNTTKSTTELKNIFAEKGPISSKKRGLDGKMLYPESTVVRDFNFEENDELMTMDDERSLSISPKNSLSECEDFSSPTEKIMKNNKSSLHKVQLMKASFYVEDDLADAEISLEKGIPDLDLFATDHVDRYRLTGATSKNIVPLIKTQFTSQFPPPIDIPFADFTDEEYRPPVLSPEVKAISSRKSIMIRTQKVVAKYRESVFPTGKSIAKDLKHPLCDSGLYFGRHFRIGWSKGLSFVCLTSALASEMLNDVKFDRFGKVLMGRQGSDTSKNLINRLQLTTELTPEFESNIEEHLRICLRGSHFSYENDVPMLQPVRGVSTLHEHCEIEQQTVRIEENYDRQVWELMVALWGNVLNLDVESNIGSHKTKMVRKAALSRWLRSVIRESNSPDRSKGDHISQVLSCLLCGDIEKACKLAIDNDDFNLSLLISQLGGNEVSRSLMEQQLKQWHESEADQLIDIGRLKIMTLVAGHMLYVSSKHIINTCEHLEWKKAFAIHLWYITRPSNSLIEALQQYESAFKLEDTFASPPTPPYIDNSKFDKLNGSQISDLCYHLLKLYSRRSYPLETVLNPVTHTENVLDYRLSWFVMTTLRSLGYGHIAKETEYEIHTSFATQLEVLGLWQWAVFILLHISDVSIRTHCVRNLIDKNVQLLPDEQIGLTSEELFINECLQIPAEWIFYSKAILAVSSTKHVEAAWYYIRARCWNEAHDIIMNNLLTRAIINEKYDQLREMLTEIVARECILRGWNHRGAVIYDYLTIVEQVNTAVSHSVDDSTFLESLQPLLSSVCTKIKFFPTTTTTERLCQAEISKRIIQLIRVILNLQYGKKGLSIRFIVSLVDQLPLPEDYKQQELQEIISWWIDK